MDSPNPIADVTCRVEPTQLLEKSEEFSVQNGTINIGLEWDFYEGLPVVDLDASAVFFSSMGHIVDAVYYNQKYLQILSFLFLLLPRSHQITPTIPFQGLLSRAMLHTVGIVNTEKMRAMMSS